MDDIDERLFIQIIKSLDDFSKVDNNIHHKEAWETLRLIHKNLPKRSKRRELFHEILNEYHSDRGTLEGRTDENGSYVKSRDLNLRPTKGGFKKSTKNYRTKIYKKKRQIHNKTKKMH